MAMIIDIRHKETDGKPAVIKLDTNFIAFIDRDMRDNWGTNRCIITMTDGTEIWAIGTVEEIAAMVQGK